VAFNAAALLSLLYLYGFYNGVMPIEALISAGEKAAYFLIVAFLSGYLSNIAKHKSRELDDTKQNIELKNKSLLKAQEQLIQSEKMSSITEITVSLNHAINNPLTSVLADIQFVLLKLKTKLDDPQTIERSISCLQTAEKEALRIKTIMEDLRHLTQPVVEDYIPGIKMIDLEKSIAASKEKK
jgi:phosphoglycerate-specific signal transduction histidine kinase